ncbi:hypothetical protein ACFQZE_06800 [Paenibacillus sp. GCM10027627]|uniref:hypothetical protein n=1 Tax=unclassified Paenibacillus TaxID=185978 RepID=UPI00363015E0
MLIVNDTTTSATNGYKTLIGNGYLATAFTNELIVPKTQTIFENQINKGDCIMENLYSVIVVNKQRDILVDKKVVAKDQKNAEFEIAHKYLVSEGISLDDVTVIVDMLGSVKVKEEKSTKECKQ